MTSDRSIHPLPIGNSVSGHSIVPGLILIAILVISAILNLMNIRFGLPYIYGRNVEGRIVAITVNAFVTGDLNPHVAIYPHLQLYLLLPAFLPYYLWGHLTGVLTSRADLLTAFQADPTPFYAISRAVTALFGTGCVLMTYLIARRLYGMNVALVSSFLASTFPLLVANSHLVTPDVIMTFFILASFYYAINIMERGRFLDYFMCGAMLGLGFTAKYPAAIAAVFVLCAHLLRKGPVSLHKEGGDLWSLPSLVVTILFGIVAIVLGLYLDLSFLALPFNRQFPGSSERITTLIRALAVLSGTVLVLLPYLTRKIRTFGNLFLNHRLFLAAIVGCVAFIIIGSPYLLIDFRLTLNALLYHAFTESRPFWGSEETPAGWIYCLHLLREGTSLPFVVFFLAGTLLLAYHHGKKDILVLSFPLVYYLFIGSSETKFPRYIVPLLPFLAIFSASIIDTSTRTGREAARVRTRKILTALALLLAIPSLIASIQWDLMMGKVDTRTVAKEWIDNNIPAGSKIAIDALGPPLSQSDFRLYIFYRGKLQSIQGRDPWGHYRLGEAKDVNVLFEEGINYAVVNSNAYGNYRRVARLYPEQYAFYMNLDSLGTLVRIFRPEDNPGPEIRVYAINPGPDNVKVPGKRNDSTVIRGNDGTTSPKPDR